MVEIGLLGVFAGISVATAFFLSFHLIGQLRHKNPALLWLGLTVLAIGFRVAKSIVFFIMNSMWPVGLSIGFFALASIGPCYLLYIRSSQDKSLKFRYKHLKHFVLPAAGAIACFIVTPHPLETTFYQIATGVLGLYIAIAYFLHRKHAYPSTDEKQWNQQTFILLFGIWFSFVLQHVTGTMIYYAYGSMIAALFIFNLFGRILKQAPVFAKQTQLSVPDDVLEKVRESFEREHIYLSVGMSVNLLAGQIEVPAYQITKAVKVLYGKTFPEALSFFRVENFKARIAKQEHQNLTIEYLAESSGFKTTSSFYNAFKKETGLTPTAYLDSISLKSA
ncbi:MAG: AraC family transcriptional regulator [Ekhidna sp.]|nr:AraC family transcriptional regulator [Ekhidna sp.]